MRIAYADPPYPGMSHLYRGHPDYAGEVDHADLVERLERDYDGWILHTASTTLDVVVPLLPAGTRIGAWVKPFAAFKRNVCPAYAWEPVIFKPARKAKPHRAGGVMRDWIAEPITPTDLTEEVPGWYQEQPSPPRIAHPMRVARFPA